MSKIHGTVGVVATSPSLQKYEHLKDISNVLHTIWEVLTLAYILYEIHERHRSANRWHRPFRL